VNRKVAELSFESNELRVLRDQFAAIVEKRISEGTPYPRSSVYCGTGDRLVTKDAVVPFMTPADSFRGILPGEHSSIKEPGNLNDTIVQLLSNEIGFVRQQCSAAALNDSLERKVADNVSAVWTMLLTAKGDDDLQRTWDLFESSFPQDNQTTEMQVLSRSIWEALGREPERPIRRIRRMLARPSKGLAAALIGAIASWSGAVKRGLRRLRKL
jgi:hypothetical protein